jgi:hypothetical protein
VTVAVETQTREYRDGAGRLMLPRDEMAFRKRYEADVIAGRLTTVFRPGNRIFPRWRGYRPGEVVTARIIEQCGDDQFRIPPTFNSLRVPIRIRAIDVRPLRLFSQADFAGSSSDVACSSSLQAHLEAIYGEDFSDPRTIVSRILIDYVDGR